MFDPKRILFTGGSGLLGRAVRKLLPEACYPTSAEFDVTAYEQMAAFVEAASKKQGAQSGEQGAGSRERGVGSTELAAGGSQEGGGRGRDAGPLEPGFPRPCPWDVLVHAATFTSPPKVDQDPERAIRVNIVGTANVARLCLAYRMKLVYISTDYVFRGDRGNYGEEDPVYPANAYAWSKLGGECAARLVPGSLIIRTSFGPDEFPYPKAFADQWTSREPVSAIARKLVEVLRHEVCGVLHIGGPRRTVFEYARSLNPSRPIGELSIREVSFAVPRDTSLNTERYERLRQQFG